MFIASIVGPRPNFVKEALINTELKKRNINEIIVHTGQHYDYEMSQIFFESFNLPQPNYHLEKRAHTNIQNTALMMNFIEKVLLKEKPDAVIVYGDVNSTMAGAIVSSKLNIPVIHIEGGIRSNQIYNPEEINRRVTDTLSKLIFVPTKTDYKNLIKENFDESRICLSGDLMKDTLLKTMKLNNISVTKKDYCVCTIHRYENVESETRLSRIIHGLIDSKKRIIFPIHPRTSTKIKEYGLWEKIVKSRIEIISPQSYVEFVKLIAGADKVLTDSGGVRREAYILSKPVVLLIDIIWFPEIHKTGWIYIAGDDCRKIVEGIHNFPKPSRKPLIFGDGNAHIKIVKKIAGFLG